MRIRLPQMIQDPDISVLDIGRVVEDWTQLDEDHYLDGPVTPRVAVVDLNPNTEKLERGAVFEPPTKRRPLGRYRVDKTAIKSIHFIQASVFATVYRTMYIYEQPDTLGRKVRWGFDAPQLLVVPRAGWLANAYYERASHSLQFFSFEAKGKTVHTSLSRDIVAHETAHALIDGIVPDLYDAYDPQSLALHEGIADLTAMLMAFSSNRLRTAILNKTEGSIRTSTAFSSIGEEFGRALDPTGKVGFLRSLTNEDRLNPNGDPADEPEPHELSQVISGVLYELMVALHERFRMARAEQLRITETSASGYALFVAAAQFKRMVLRGLDYLPPGEVTFADFGRAILAADQASFDDESWRLWLRGHFAKRGIVKRAADLDVKTNFANAAVAGADLQALVDSQWAAYSFADANRELLGIPPDAQFEVLERIVVEGRFESAAAAKDRAAGTRSAAAAKDAGAEDDEAEGGAADKDTLPVKELLFKVRWSVLERNPKDIGGQRRTQTGTTLVIDWNKGVIRSLLRPLDFKGRKPARDAMLRRLVEAGVVEIMEADEKAKRGATATGIDAVVTDGVLRVKNTARLLHMVKEIDE